MSMMPEAILGNCGPVWMKVARIVALTHRQLGLPDNDASYDLVALELSKLVEAGKLEAVGDLSKWTHSEVRLVTS